MKSEASQVPAAAPGALMTLAIETRTVETRTGWPLMLSNVPLSVWAGTPGLTGPRSAV